MSKSSSSPMETMRWKAFWALNRMKNTGMDEMYREDKEAFRNGIDKDILHKKVQAILDHARKNTAYYKDIPENASLSDFPIVDKEDLRNNYEAHMVPDFANAKGSRKMSTSGSTGTPLTVIQDRDKVLHDTADGIFLGVLGNYYIGQKMAFIRVWVDNVKKSRLTLFMQNYIMMDSSRLDDESIYKMLEILKRTKTKCIVGYASALTEISRYIDKADYDLSKMSIESIIPISEAMPMGVRENLKRQFKCPVQSWYSNEENGIMGIQGPNSEDYYINSACYFYEVLKFENDEPAKDGEPGRIVITDLHNKAFPIIRYDNGDTAVARHVTDEKGRYKLFLTSIGGRRSDMIYDTKGKGLTPFIITNNLWNVTGVRQYQFIQKGEKEYLLKLNGDKAAMDISDITGRIKPYLGEDALINVEFADEIPVLASGKRKYIVNEYKVNEDTGNR